jgi:hypothetical protein
MTIEAIITINKIEAIFFREMRDIIKKTASDTMSEKYMLVDVNEIGSSIPENDKSFGVKFSYNTLTQKKIGWQFVVYIDFYGRDRFLTDLWISNKKEDECSNNVKRKSFRLKDYCKFRNIMFLEKFEKGQQILSIIDNWVEVESYLIEYLSFIKNVINQDEMQKILFTEYWTNVPIDWSPYK